MLAQPAQTQETPAVSMKQRQAPLRRLYQDAPGAARIIDSARTSCDDINALHPAHGRVVIGKTQPTGLDTGIHEAIGGFHDLPNPGEILAAALASCLDSTIRIIANLMNVELDHLEVSVDLAVDVRGTLMIERSVPVGFQSADIEVNMAAEGASDAQLDMILKAAEKCCVIMQTLRNPPALNIKRQ